MSAKTIYTCDYCGAACSGNVYVSLWDEGVEATAYKNTRLDGCSKEHLGIVVAKTFGIYANAPANQCTDAERKQFEITIEQQKGRIAELEKQIATLNDWAAICGGKAQTVDGKTPAQVGRAEYEVAYHAQMGTGCSLNASYLFAWERAAQAVLRAFGPALAKQAVVEALGKVRERIQETITKSSKWMALSIIEAEIARLDAPKPTSDHTHELGSCSFCDKPETITIPTKPTKPARVHGNCKACSGIGEIVCADCDGSGKHECAYCGGTGEYSAAEGNGP